MVEIISTMNLVSGRFCFYLWAPDGRFVLHLFSTILVVRKFLPVDLLLRDADVTELYMHNKAERAASYGAIVGGAHADRNALWGGCWRQVPIAY